MKKKYNYRSKRIIIERYQMDPLSYLRYLSEPLRLSRMVFIHCNEVIIGCTFLKIHPVLPESTRLLYCSLHPTLLIHHSHANQLQIPYQALLLLVQEQILILQVQIRVLLQQVPFLLQKPQTELLRVQTKSLILQIQMWTP